MDLDGAVAEFLSYLEYEKGPADLTLISYESDFRQVADFLDEQGIPQKIDDVTTAVVRRYVAAMSKDGYARLLHPIAQLRLAALPLAQPPPPNMSRTADSASCITSSTRSRS